MLVDDLYDTMLGAAKRLIETVGITDEELAAAFVIVRREYGDPSTERGRGYIYACTARAIGIQRVRVTHPLWLEAEASIRAYEEVADGAAELTSETIMTIDRRRRPALWAELGRPPEIVRRPGLLDGDWVVWGTRIRPEVVEAEIAAGQDEEQIIAGYPTLPRGVVAAVQRWRLAIESLDDGIVEVLDFSTVELSPRDPPAIVYLARNKIGVRGDFVVSIGDLDLPDVVVSSRRVGDMIRSDLRRRLDQALDALVERWDRKKAIAGEDIGWSEWQQRIDVAF